MVISGIEASFGSDNGLIVRLIAIAGRESLEISIFIRMK